jgi:hypothetical protein
VGDIANGERVGDKVGDFVGVMDEELKETIELLQR